MGSRTTTTLVFRGGDARGEGEELEFGVGAGTLDGQVEQGGVEVGHADEVAVVGEVDLFALLQGVGDEPVAGEDPVAGQFLAGAGLLDPGAGGGGDEPAPVLVAEADADRLPGGGLVGGPPGHGG